MALTVDWAVSPARWEAFVAGCPRATFFHTHAWHAANAAVLGYVPAAALIRFEDGQEALLPLSVAKRFKGLVAVALAGVETGYGGLVSPEPLSPERVAAAYAAVRKVYPDLDVTGNPFEAYSNVPPGGSVQEDDTLVLPVLGPEAQRERMSSTRVKQCKRARKAGFRLEVVEGLGVDDVERFYPLYARHAAGWAYQKWVRDEAYFRTLAVHAGPKLVLVLAYQGDDLAGFRILGVTGPVVMDLFLATDEAFERLNVGPLLAEAALDWCREKGYRALDLQPGGVLDGVRRYKMSFGPERLRHVHTSHQGLAGRSIELAWRLATKKRARTSRASSLEKVAG